MDREEYILSILQDNGLVDKSVHAYEGGLSITVISRGNGINNPSSNAGLFTFHTNAIEKGMNPSLLFSFFAVGK